jgi:hypothetical protein
MHRFAMRRTFAASAAALVFAVVLFAAPHRVLADPIERVLSTPTGWIWYYGITPSQLSAVVNSGTYRIVDLQAESATTAGPVFTVALVANTGAYAKGWWWYYGQSIAQVSSALSANQARLISIAPYVVNGTTYFASVMVPNTGADAKSWYWWVGSLSAISSDLAGTGARLVDLEPFATASGTQYAAIAIANSGADADSWWWYVNDSLASLSGQVATNKAQLLTFNTEPGGSATFDAVMQGNPTAPWWYYAGTTPSSLSALVTENGARLTEVRSDFSTGARTMNAIMINNSTPCTTRVIGIQHANGTGWNGDYLKQIAGAGVNDASPGLDCSAADARPFEPASSIKVVIGAYVMSLVEAGSETLGEKVPLLNPNNVCGFTQTGTETLKNALTQMLENSDNSRTNMFLQRYGLSTLTNYAHSIGMANTAFNSLIDCPGPHNTLTLDDAATIYTGLDKHTILNAQRTNQLFSYMAGRNYDFAGTWGAMQDIISEVAPKKLTPAQIASFEAAITLTYKSGGYTWPGGIPDLNGQTEFGDVSIAGVVGIPYCKATTVEKRTYVFGFFHESTASDADQTPVFDAMGAGAEMVRERLKTSLATWSNCG